MKNTIKNNFNKNSLIIGLAFISLLCNLFFLTTGFISQIKHGNNMSFEPGLQFADFKEALFKVKKAGYISNKDLSSENNDGQFLMAQYMLAPTALDPKSSENKYNILDCTSKNHVLFALKSINAAPIIINKYGKILAIRK